MADPRLELIFSKVADALKVDKSIVEQVGYLPESVKILDQFFKSGGPCKIFWFENTKEGNEETTDFDDSATVKSGYSSYTMQTSLTQTTKDSHGDLTVNMDALSATRSPRFEDAAAAVALTIDPSKLALKENAIIAYFLKRDSKTAITAKNIDDMTFGIINGSAGILEDVRKKLELYLVPQLRQQTNWGELSKAQTAEAQKEVREFLEQVDRFSATITEAIQSLKGSVLLDAPKKNFNIESKSKSYQKAAQRQEVVSSFEETVEDWCKQIEVLLGEVTAVREENDESGPSVELEYWKARMAKFNSITDQLRGKKCKTVLGVLKYAKSPLLNSWKTLDIKITDAANEAKVQLQMSNLNTRTM